jgi:hypothetical protein
MAEKYTHIDLSYTHLKLAGNPADEGCHRQHIIQVKGGQKK